MSLLSLYLQYQQARKVLSDCQARHPKAVPWATRQLEEARAAYSEAVRVAGIPPKRRPTENVQRGRKYPPRSQLPEPAAGQGSPAAVLPRFRPLSEYLGGDQ
jgi:hypothetical protein